jgi:hypothetical protein
MKEICTPDARLGEGMESLDLYSTMTLAPNQSITVLPSGGTSACRKKGGGGGEGFSQKWGGGGLPLHEHCQQDRSVCWLIPSFGCVKSDNVRQLREVGNVKLFRPCLCSV